MPAAVDAPSHVASAPLAGASPSPALAPPDDAAPSPASAPSPDARPPAVDFPPPLPLIAVHELDWDAVARAADPAALRARMRDIVERMEALLDRAGGPGLLFDSDRAHPGDRAIRVSALDLAGPLWIVGDLHGDLLALESALAQIRAAAADGAPAPRIVFLGDFFDDEGFGLEVLLRVFELIVGAPGRVCVVCGNHDEALSFDGVRFASTVSPSDFSEFLNAHRTHEWIERAGKLAVRLTAHAPRALFLPDGLLIAHGGFPLVDLHARLAASADWNDPACLADFVWARAHPKARRKLPNRYARGSQFGHEDFADFCALSARLGRPVTHMARGHDHVDERWAIHPAYRSHPILTTVALSRRLGREPYGPYERAPTLARVVEGRLPQVHQLHVPAGLIHALFPPPAPPLDAAPAGAGEATRP